MTLPWDINEARDALAASSAAQRNAETAFRDAVKHAAIAEEAYRVALAQRITELRAEGAAATTAADLARGDVAVARLRRDRDIADGVREAMSQVAWRASADRKDCQSLALWSMRRELAENGAPVDDRPLAGMTA